MSKKIIRLFIRGGAQVGDERTIKTMDGRTLTGKVRESLAGKLGFRDLIGGKRLDLGEDLFNVEVNDD